MKRHVVDYKALGLIQIAITGEGGYTTLYGLDKDGVIWWRCTNYYLGNGITGEAWVEL